LADRFGPFYLDFSPRRVMFSGWIGDNDPTFKGMEDALRKYLQSAWAGIAIQDAKFFSSLLQNGMETGFNTCSHHLKRSYRNSFNHFSATILLIQVSVFLCIWLL